MTHRLGQHQHIVWLSLSHLAAAAVAALTIQLTSIAWWPMGILLGLAAGLLLSGPLHVGNILSKLHLAHRAQAIIYALKQGLVSVEDLDLKFLAAP